MFVVLPDTSVAAARLAFRDLPLPKRWLDDWLLHTLGEESSAFFISHGDRRLNADEAQRLTQGIQRMLQGEPLAYVRNRAYFWRFAFFVNADALVPRPDTELLVQTALDLLGKQKARVLDMGTGSGCIAISLALEAEQWTVSACDVCPKALAVAKKNARDLGAKVDFFLSDWFGAAAGNFDLIVANPPYIDARDPHLPALRAEPQGALVAKDGGMADIRAIAKGALAHLNAGGYLLVEHGHDQGQKTRLCFKEAGFLGVQTLKDYGGNDRLTLGKTAKIHTDEPPRAP